MSQKRLVGVIGETLRHLQKVIDFHRRGAGFYYNWQGRYPLFKKED